MKKILQHITCFWMATLFGISLLVTGCVKKEVTRIADWETHFTDIYFADAKHGWIVGHQGWILHTADGGENWEKQTVNTNEDFEAVYFTNLRNGWAVGDKGLIATTDDGGRHWALQKRQAHVLLMDVFFTNSKTGWITGQDGLLYTQNGGKTWNHQEASEFGLGGVCFIDKHRGWIVGDYDRIFVTADGSQTWRRQDNLVRTEQDTTTVCNLSTIFFATPYEGWSGGTDGTIFHTTNGGTEWHSQDSRLPPVYGHVRPTVNEFHFINDDYGAAVAQGGLITRTEDGGDNWILTESPTKNDLMGVHFATPKEAWAVGWNGTLLHSTDGGVTWNMRSGTTADACRASHLPMQTVRLPLERRALSRRVTTVAKPGPILRWTHGTASVIYLSSLTGKAGRLATAGSSSTQPMQVRRGNGKPADGGIPSMPSISSIHRKAGSLEIWEPCCIQQTVAKRGYNKHHATFTK